MVDGQLEPTIPLREEIGLPFVLTATAIFIACAILVIGLSFKIKSLRSVRVNCRPSLALPLLFRPSSTTFVGTVLRGSSILRAAGSVGSPRGELSSKFSLPP